MKGSVSMSKNTTSSESNMEIHEERIITDPTLVLTLLHEKKRMIVNLLLKNAMTIQELKNATKMNPGTIKRHLDDLMKNDLIFIAEERLNDYNIKMKFYQATARRFIINFTLPE
ncbi:hypothetical protein WKT22_05246 [Candidatus Lokiarchaeum ossiferum]